MAKYETTKNIDFNVLKKGIIEDVTKGSLSASLEDESNYQTGDVRSCLLVFERYSWSGSNRVSLTVQLIQGANKPVHISCITSGGSKAVLFKVNRIGESTFLENIKEYLDNL